MSMSSTAYSNLLVAAVKNKLITHRQARKRWLTHCDEKSQLNIVTEGEQPHETTHE